MASEQPDTSGTPFVAGRCADCGTFVVSVPGQVDPLCMDCRRARCGIDWPLALPVGAWHPTVGSVQAEDSPPVPEVPAPGRGGTAWRWGCLLCGETGQADYPEHALRLESSHRAYACPKAPGLDHFERRRREAWAKVRREVYNN